MHKPRWRVAARQKHDICNFATASVRILNGISTLGVVPTTRDRHIG